MAKTFTAPFAQNNITAHAVATSHCSSLTSDNPSTIYPLYTAPSEGALITSVTAIPRGTVSATALYLFIKNSASNAKRLKDSALMSAHSLNATTAIPLSTFERITPDTPLRLRGGDELHVGLGASQGAGIVFNLEGMEY